LEDEIVVTQQDITESVEARMNLEQLNESLKQKNVELKYRNQELANFAFIASHDLREPLRKILVFSNYLVEKESENLTAQGRDYCLKIILSINRMNALIDDILEYSRASSTPGKKFSEVDLNEVLKTVLADISEYIAEHDATVDAESLPVINGNSLQLSQLLQNLIINGIKFNREGVKPYIVVRSAMISGRDIESPSADRTMKYIKIDVADNGIGFDPKFEDKIFQMFQRLHDRSNFPGTGMGLAICKRVVQNHQGFITAKGYPGSGAVFSSYFPIGNKKKPDV
jgi:light-regulated signal transduction histidine kinase (bacteriophytochrome)